MAGFTYNSIADIPEPQIVDRLLSDPNWRTEFFELAGMPQGMENRQQVLLYSAPGNPKGEIDALLCVPNRPEQTVAYEVKRIKFGINQLRNKTPAKLEEYEKLAQQTKRLAQMGFWQVYAFVIVVVDAREQNAGQNTFAGLSSELKRRVDSEISIDLLDPRVGLLVLEITQPMDYEPFTVGARGLILRRSSTPVIQSQELTEWVAGVFSKPQQLNL